MIGKSPESSSPAWPLFLALLAAILLATIVGHVLMRMPVAFGDNFDEIVATYRTPLTIRVAKEFAQPGVLFSTL